MIRRVENGGCSLCWPPKQLPTHTGSLSVLILETRSTLKPLRKRGEGEEKRGIEYRRYVDDE